MNSAYFPLLVKIGAGIGKKTPGAAVKGLNSALTTAGTAIGAVLLTVAAIKMVLAIANEDARSRSESTILASVGILFVSISQVIKVLGIDQISGSTSVNTVAANIITVITTMLTWAGGLLAVFTVFTLILSIAQENSDGYVNGTKLLGVSVGLLSIGALGNSIKGLLMSNVSSGARYASAISGFLASAATYIGGGLAVVGVFKMILSVREENSKDRETAIKFLLTGIALIGIRGILWGMGISTS